MYTVEILTSKQDLPLAIEIISDLSRHCFGIFKGYEDNIITVEVSHSCILFFLNNIKKYKYTIISIFTRDNNIYDKWNRKTSNLITEIDKEISKLILESPNPHNNC